MREEKQFTQGRVCHAKQNDDEQSNINIHARNLAGSVKLVLMPPKNS